MRTIRARLAALAAGTGGLHFVDVSTPALPGLIRTESLADPVTAVVLRDGTAFVAAGTKLLVLDVATGDLRQTVELGGAQLQDVVRDQAGNPIADAVVEVEGADLRDTTDDEGRFGFDIAPGTYTLIIRFDGWTQHRSVTVRNSGYTLTLNYGGKAAT